MLGAMVLAHSLRDNGTKAKLVALVTLESLNDSTVQELKVVLATGDALNTRNCTGLTRRNRRFRLSVRHGFLRGRDWAARRNGA